MSAACPAATAKDEADEPDFEVGESPFDPRFEVGESLVDSRFEAVEVGLGGDALGDGVADGLGMCFGLGFVDADGLEAARVGQRIEAGNGHGHGHARTLAPFRRRVDSPRGRGCGRGADDGSVGGGRRRSQVALPRGI